MPKPYFALNLVETDCPRRYEGRQIAERDQKSISETLRVMKQFALYRMQLTSESSGMHSEVEEWRTKLDEAVQGMLAIGFPKDKLWSRRALARPSYI